MNQQLLDIAPDIGDLMNRYLATMQSQLHISPLALMEKNLEPKQKLKCRRRTALKHCGLPRTVERNSELRKKQRESRMQRTLLPMLPRLAVEAIRPNLPMPVANQKAEVEASRLMPHNLMINLRRFPKAVQGVEDPTKFQD